METEEVCEKIFNGIVAITPKYLKMKKPPIVPPIIGTGCIVDEDGLILTCDHVLKAIEKLEKPKNIPKNDIPIRVFRFIKVREGKEFHIINDVIEVLNTILISDFDYKINSYPKGIPDIGFIHVDKSKLQKIDLCKDFLNVVPGMDVITGGYPLGEYLLLGSKKEDGILVDEWVNQVSPTFQKGIVSSVLPGVCRNPHGIITNIMSPEGSSGSPLVNNIGELIGVMSYRIYQIDQIRDNRELGINYKIPTNFSKAITTFFIQKVIEMIKNDKNFSVSKNVLDLNEASRRSKLDPKNMLNYERFNED